MVDQTGFVAVAGGANIDIGGTSHAPLIAHDSNPGCVKTSPGGVARNIAHNLSLLGIPVTLYTALGEDMHAERIIRSCDELRMELIACRTAALSTSTYLYITDDTGEMSCAISDMEICTCLTPEFFEPHMETINRARALVIDTNLPEETIVYLTTHARVPVFADPVSVTKAARLKQVLPKLHTIKPNRLEAELLSGTSISDTEDALRAARLLLDQGLQQVFLTLGADGLLAACTDGWEIVTPATRKVVGLNGAGDALMAGLIYAYTQGCTLIEEARYASAAAAVAAAVTESVNDSMSPEKLRGLTVK